MPIEGPPPQPMLPRGFAGRVFGFLMERGAASNYRWVIDQLRTTEPRTYLEIGFGTGKLAQLVARELKPTCICGVDPSGLMFQQTSRRLARYARTIEVDLRVGNDAHLPWAERSFDAIVASHSFQFWSDPHFTLRHIHRLIKPTGRLVLVLRNHRHISKKVRKWIPNPITKSGNEIGAVRHALAEVDFRIVCDQRLTTGSQGVIAECV
jgi:ubiquinone/menaquinone biosynthesis C-methylase UbiE